eukprot:m.117954 g.117954  ORF g.117954 m.117954 type:complete len:52 (-) comp15440_c1_seq1:22-177(-)
MLLSFPFYFSPFCLFLLSLSFSPFLLLLLSPSSPCFRSIIVLATFFVDLFW